MNRLTRGAKVAIVIIAVLCFGIWLLSRTTDEQPTTDSDVQSMASNDSSAGTQVDLWSTQDSKEESYCISQRPQVPERDENDTRWRLQDLAINHASFLIYQTLVHCFLQYRAPQWMAMNAGVLEGDAQRFESNGFARMQEAINISGNEMNTCYTAEPMAALNAVEEESLLIGEAHATDNLNRRLQEHINSDTSGLDNFVVDFDSQAGGATESRVGLSADLHRAQTMRNEAIENLNKHDFANALLAAEDSTLLYQSARDEINCPNMQINIRSAQ